VISDDPREDWTKITPEANTWAMRERRRSSAFGRINNPIVGFKTSSTSASGEERKGSILSLWTSRTDENGNHVLSSDGGRLIQMDTKPAPVLTREQMLDAREAALKERERQLQQAALDIREKALEVKEQEIAMMEASRKE